MSTTPPPNVDEDEQTKRSSQIDLGEIDLSAPQVENGEEDHEAPPSDDMFFSTVQDQPYKQAEPAKPTNENMDDIFRMNRGTANIKLTDDEDEMFGDAAPSHQPSSMAQPAKAASINIKPIINTPEPQHSFEASPASPKLASSFKKQTSEKTFTPEEEEDDAESRDKFLQITVSDPHKVGDGMGSFMEYHVSVKTNYPAFKSTEFTTKRRFSDFLTLYDKLKEKNVLLGRILPPAPEKDAIGMARVKMSKEDATPLDFVEKRRAALQRFMERLAAHKVLRYDPDFRDFLEISDALPKTSNTSALSGAGVFKMFKNVSQSVANIAIRMDETDQWFEEKTHEIDALHIQFKKMHSIAEILYGWRKDLAISARDFSKSMAILSNSEEQLSLSRALSQLGEIYEKVEQLDLEQSNADYFVFSELMKDYVCLYENIKDVFHNRIKCYSHWQKAEETLKSKQETSAKLEAANKLDKLPAAAMEVRDWTAKVEKHKEEFEQISKAIKEEMKRFDSNRAKEFKQQLTKYLQSLLNNQEALVKIWEQYLPQVKAI